jgi:hypothetical protein
VEAQETYRRIVREGAAPGSPSAFAKAVEDAGRELQPLSSRIGTVTITVTSRAGEAVPGARVSWDGAPINNATLGAKRPADPGPHVLRVTADGYQPLELTVVVPTGAGVDAPASLAKDATASAPVPPAPTAAPAPSAAAAPPAVTAEPPSRQDSPAANGSWGPWPWVAFGVGGAGLATGAVTGALAMSKRSSIIGQCPGGVCAPAQRSDVDTYNTLGLVSTIGFVVGGVGAAAGIVLLLVPPPKPTTTAEVHWVPVVGPGSLGAAGTF